MFMEDLRPWKYYKDILSINYDYLIHNNYNILLFDLDNTILNNRETVVSNDIINLFTNLKRMGFTVLIVSNALPGRVQNVAKVLGVKGYGLAFKPFIKKIYKIKQAKKFNIENMVVIGDQLFTDIKAAKKLGIKSILVDPIDVYEPFITVFNRGRENDLINRGDYYE